MLTSLVQPTPSAEPIITREALIALAITFTEIIRHIPATIPAQPTQVAATQHLLNYKALATQTKHVL